VLKRLAVGSRIGRVVFFVCEIIKKKVERVKLDLSFVQLSTDISCENYKTN